MKKLLLILCLLIASVAGAVTAPITATLSNFTSTPSNAYLTVTLKSSSVCVLSSQSTGVTISNYTLNFYPDATGLVSDVIIPNSDILCNGVAGTTSYCIAVMKRGVNGGANTQLTSACYIVGLSGVIVGITAPIVGTPPSFAYDYAVRNAPNVFTSKNDFTGAQLAGLPIAPAFIIDTPDGTLDAIFGAYISQSVTLTRIRCSTIGTGSVTIQLEVRSNPDVSGVSVLSSPLVCDTTKPFTTSFSQASITAANYLVLRINSVVSTPNWLRVYIEY